MDAVLCVWVFARMQPVIVKNMDFLNTISDYFQELTWNKCFCIFAISFKGVIIYILWCFIVPVHNTWL